MNNDRGGKKTTLIKIKMSNQIKNQTCTNRLSMGGLLAFLRIRALLGCLFDVDQDPCLVLETRAGIFSGLNLCPNLLTNPMQHPSGTATQALVRHFGALRPFVFPTVLPYARGKPREPGRHISNPFKLKSFKNTPS